MRFLVTSRPKFPAPPDALPMLIGAMHRWAAEHMKSGQLEQVWGYAVGGGGGGLVNVKSHEELNAVMTAMPFAPFAEMTAEPIVPLEVSLKAVEEMAKKMSAK